MQCWMAARHYTMWLNIWGLRKYSFMMPLPFSSKNTAYIINAMGKDLSLQTVGSI